MSYRSEANRIGNKQNYQDLNLSHYPNTIDTRSNNNNMRGFINVGEGQIPDYVMAEYVNAAMDAIMAVQRTLGTTPMVPSDVSSNVNNLIENSTVDERIGRIEDGLFDERYGGSGWRFVANRPTLSAHNHDGQNGHPSRIHLVNEVTGNLRRQNINLENNSNGLTGAHIFVSSANPVRISEAIEDALSQSEGGTVQGPLTLRGRFTSRTRMDALATELPLLSNVSLVSDGNATAGRALRLTSAGSTGDIFRITAQDRQDMLYGRYVLGLRVRSTNTTSNNVLRLALGSQQESVTGAHIGSSYGQIYIVFTHDSSTVGQDLRIQKLATSGSTSIHVDSVFIEPMHPAVLDR